MTSRIIEETEAAYPNLLILAGQELPDHDAPGFVVMLESRELGMFAVCRYGDIVGRFASVCKFRTRKAANMSYRAHLENNPQRTNFAE